MVAMGWSEHTGYNTSQEVDSPGALYYE